jgi:glycosyl transferase family 25
MPGLEFDVTPESPRRFLTLLINLPQSCERLALASAELTKAGISFERVDAVDGRRLQGEELARFGLGWRKRYFQTLRPGEIGCYLSHLRALERFLASDHEIALIVEDDLHIASDAARCIHELLGLRHELPPAVNLFGARARGEVLRTLLTGHQLVRSTSVPRGTVAILWTRSGAKSMLQGAGALDRPIDVDRKHWWERECPPIWINPAPFVEHAGDCTPSTITGRKQAGWTVRLRKARYRGSFTLRSHAEYAKAFGFQGWVRALKPIRELTEP